MSSLRAKKAARLRTASEVYLKFKCLFLPCILMKFHKRSDYHFRI